MQERNISIAEELISSETEKGLPFEISTAEVGILSLGKKFIEKPSLIDEQFTPEEKLHCNNKIERYAGRHAGKIALRQLIRYVNPHDISIEALVTGQPVIRLSGWAERSAEDKKIQISISHDADVAVAMVVVSPFGIQEPGIGVDVTSVSRIRRAIDERSDRFLSRQFTKPELDEAGGDGYKLAQMWAGKEAVVKALRTGFGREGVSWKNIEILESGVILNGDAHKKADQLGYENWKLFLDDKSGDAQSAYVLAY